MKRSKSNTSLTQTIYRLAARIPSGRVTTYKALAHAADTRAYRAVGQIMKHNPYAREASPELGRRVPCHRVVSSDGTIGGFMGETEGIAVRKKIALLKNEGIRIRGNRIIDFQTILFRF